MEDIYLLKKVSFHAPIDKEAFNFRHEKFSELIPEDSIVLDIGAHVGGFSIVFGSCVSKGKVLAFEPNPLSFEKLKQNADNNPDLNIVPLNYATTAETRDYTFYYTDPARYGAGTNGGNFDELSIKDQSKQIYNTPVEVKGVNLYDFLLENYKDELHKIKFIKIDTEGYDKEVLKTIIPLIKQNKPILMVEAFQELSSEEIQDFYNLMENILEYKMYDVSPLDNKTDCTGPISRDEIEYYVHKVILNGNFFCFHKDEVQKYNLPTTIPNKTAVIIIGRNDGYKEEERFVIHLKTMLETFDEVIYVDWNSDTHSLLYDVMDKLPKTGRLKHFVIPPEYAKMMSAYDEKAQVCNSVLAFNIGLRRTDAEWVVFSTIDIIPPNRKTLQQFISNADKHSFYTFSRRDVEYESFIVNLNNLDKYRKILDATSTPRYFPAKVTPNDNYSIFNCCGDFQLAPKNLWYKIRGYEEPMLYACFADTNAQKKAVLYGFNLIPIYDVPLYHMSHKGMGNDGASPSKQYYNSALEWVETYDKFNEYEHILISRNADTWGYSNVEIEYEVI